MKNKMENKIILEILELCEDESYKNNFLNSINTPDAFTRGLLAGHKEIAIKILDIIRKESKALHGVTNVMYNRHQLKLVIPSENPDRIEEPENWSDGYKEWVNKKEKEPEMWEHYCDKEKSMMAVGKGEPCNWCGKEEKDGGNC